MSTTPPDSLYKVIVRDNFHYMDKSSEYELGVHATWDEAVIACRKVVESEIDPWFKPAMSAEELYSMYVMFGEDPFVVPPPGKPTNDVFSAWDYAKIYCEILVQNRR